MSRGVLVTALVTGTALVGAGYYLTRQQRPRALPTTVVSIITPVIDLGVAEEVLAAMQRIPGDEVTVVLHTAGGCVTSCVLIANALHIMPRPEKALAEIYRVLKPGGQLFAPTFVHGEVPRTRLRMLAMRCAGLQIYNSWMVPQYLAFLQAGGFAVQEHALLGDTLAPLCYARAVPDKTRVTQR